MFMIQSNLREELIESLEPDWDLSDKAKEKVHDLKLQAENESTNPPPQKIGHHPYLGGKLYLTCIQAIAQEVSLLYLQLI